MDDSFAQIAQKKIIKRLYKIYQFTFPFINVNFSI